MMSKQIRFKGAVYRLADTTQSIKFVSTFCRLEIYVELLFNLGVTVGQQYAKKEADYIYEYTDWSSGDGLLPGHEYACDKALKEQDKNLYDFTEAPDVRLRVMDTLHQGFIHGYKEALP